MAAPDFSGGETAMLQFEGVEVDDANIARDADAAIAAMLCAGQLALGAEALGLADAALEMTIGYLKQRMQFGKPLSSFQALQHRLADMAMEIEQLRSAVVNAAAALDGDTHRRDLACSALKHLAGETGRRVAEETIQMHGGIGMTAEYGLSRYARRLVMLDHRLGDCDWHLARFAELSRVRMEDDHG
jgi:alkylation response protein AidB-like acyl-CoA dehydrogenase